MLRPALSVAVKSLLVCDLDSLLGHHACGERGLKDLKGVTRKGRATQVNRKCSRNRINVEW